MVLIEAASLSEWRIERRRIGGGGRTCVSDCLWMSACRSVRPHYCHQSKTQNKEVKDNLRTPILVFNCWIHASPVLGTTWRWVCKVWTTSIFTCFHTRTLTKEQSRVNAGKAQRERWELQTLSGKSYCIHSPVAFLPRSFSWSSSPRERNTGD